MEPIDAQRVRRPRTPEPTKAERLEALYGDRWEIYREGGPGIGHGPWTARRIGPAKDEPDMLTAPDIDSLGERLAAES
jgi:hypothetical protein